jgi:cell shape-determining protein MreC
MLKSISHLCSSYLDQHRAIQKKEIACPDCKVLLSKIKSLELKISNLEKENQALKKKLHKYENPHTPPSRLYSNNNSSLTPKKPGRKKGHMG